MIELFVIAAAIALPDCSAPGPYEHGPCPPGVIHQWRFVGNGAYHIEATEARPSTNSILKKPYINCDWFPNRVVRCEELTSGTNCPRPMNIRHRHTFTDTHSISTTTTNTTTAGISINIAPILTALSVSGSRSLSVGASMQGSYAHEIEYNGDPPANMRSCRRYHYWYEIIETFVSVDLFAYRTSYYRDESLECNVGVKRVQCRPVLWGTGTAYGVDGPFSVNRPDGNVEYAPNCGECICSE